MLVIIWARKDKKHYICYSKQDSHYFLLDKTNFKKI